VTFGTFNYSVVAVAVVLFGAGGWYLLSAKKWFHGPQIEGNPEELRRIELELGGPVPVEGLPEEAPAGEPA
jgi:hypothetical protein